MPKRIDTLGPSEIPQATRFEQALIRLSGPIESRTPITPEDLDLQSITAIRETLIGIGANLENPTQETLDSLFGPQTQIRNLNNQRGIAVRNIFGPEKAQQIFDDIPKLIPHAPKMIDDKTGLPIEGSQGRGLRHFLVLLCGIAIDPTQTSWFIKELNTRAISPVYKKLSRERKQLFVPHIHPQWIIKRRNHASFSKDSLPKFFDYLKMGQTIGK